MNHNYGVQHSGGHEDGIHVTCHSRRTAPTPSIESRRVQEAVGAEAVGECYVVRLRTPTLTIAAGNSLLAAGQLEYTSESTKIED